MLIRDGEKGYGGGGRGRLYLSLHSHHQNDPCFKVGSDESHFNVSLIVRIKVTRQCPQTTTFEQKGEPKRIRTEVPLLTSLTARPNRLTHTGAGSECLQRTTHGYDMLVTRRDISRSGIGQNYFPLG